MKVLLVNHKKQRCGVQQFGQIIAEILEGSEKFRLDYCEVESEDEFRACYTPEDDVVIYNYHDQTMPWLSNSITNSVKARQFCLTGHDHFADFESTKNIVADPSGIDDEKTFYTPRPLPKESTKVHLSPRLRSQAYKNEQWTPVIGSFGFGFYQKNFTRLATLVNEQFEKAIIRLHVPGNDFADPSDSMANMFLHTVGQSLKPGIEFQPSCGFKTREEMVDWLASNDLNLFVYDEQPGRGISSAIDFALAARVPFGISKSAMFRHIYEEERILVDKTPLKQIILNGIEPLQPFLDKWSRDKFRERYEDILSNEIHQSQG